MKELLIKQKVNDKVDEITDFIINEYQMPITAINYANRMLDFIFELKNHPYAHAFCRQYFKDSSKFRCAVFEKKWIIKYLVIEKYVIVEDIIWGASIK
jgi:hypothetical protein